MAEDKKVMLFSGGMDSYCMRHIIKPDVTLFFMLGTKDNIQEFQNLKNMPFFNEVKIIEMPLYPWEMENKILPHRNTILSLIASNYGNQIYLGATAGDTTKDKDYIFKSQIEGMLNYFALDSHKIPVKSYPFTMNLPFKKLSKTEILKLFIKEKGIVPELLKYSRSCYEGKEKECGNCRSCLRKAIALELNDVDYSGVFEKDPFKNVSEEIVTKMTERKTEANEFIKAYIKWKKR
jgi:7-cyano-7-deazaguanine synthase